MATPSVCACCQRRHGHARESTIWTRQDPDRDRDECRVVWEVHGPRSCARVLFACGQHSERRESRCPRRVCREGAQARVSKVFGCFAFDPCNVTRVSGPQIEHKAVCNECLIFQKMYNYKKQCFSRCRSLSRVSDACDCASAVNSIFAFRVRWVADTAPRL